MDNRLRRSSTNRTYVSLVEKWIKPIAYEQWDEDYFWDTINHWIKVEQLAPRTVKTLLRLLGEYIYSVHGIELPIKEATSQVMRLVQDKEIKALTKDQSKLLLDEIESTELYLPALLALHTGMRRGEVFGLMWSDVDICRSEIKIQRSYNGPTKNGKSRVVPISPLLEEALLDIYSHNPDNSSKKPVIAKQFDPNPGLRAACRRIGINPVNFHALRHTFATMALEAGRSPRKVQQVLGHSALSTTLNIYWSTTQEKLDVEFLK